MCGPGVGRGARVPSTQGAAGAMRQVVAAGVYSMHPGRWLAGGCPGGWGASPGPLPRGPSLRSLVAAPSAPGEWRWGGPGGRGHRVRSPWAGGPVPRPPASGAGGGPGPPPLLALCLALWTPAHVSKSEGQPLRLTQPRAEVSTGDALRAGGLPHTILQLCSEHRIQLPPGFVTAPRGLSAPGVLCAAGQTCAHPPFLMGAEQA